MAIKASQRRKVLAALEKGKTQPEAAKEAGVSRRTVARIVDKERKSKARQADVTDAPAEVPEEVPADPEESVAVLRSLIARERQAYREARASGEDLAAQRAARTLAALMPVLERSEARKDREADVVVIPRGEIAERRQRLREVLAAYASEPLRCVECNRRIRTAWAEEADG